MTKTRHDLTLHRAAVAGTWAVCACGWSSPSYVTVTGAHLAFGTHLKEIALSDKLTASTVTDDQLDELHTELARLRAELVRARAEVRRRGTDLVRLSAVLQRTWEAAELLYPDHARHTVLAALDDSALTVKRRGCPDPIKCDHEARAERVTVAIQRVREHARGCHDPASAHDAELRGYRRALADVLNLLDGTVPVTNDDDDDDDDDEPAPCTACGKPWHKRHRCDAVGTGSHRCPYCGEPTTYQVFSGGREWYCEGCNAEGTYPQDETPVRANPLRTEAGREELRQQLSAHLGHSGDEDRDSTRGESDHPDD